MNYKISSTLALVAALLTIGCATKKSTDATAPSGPPDATLSFGGGSAAYWAAAGAGGGKLNYQGVTRNFKVVTAGAGGTGAQTMEGTGEVYNLKSLADFPGLYTGARSGLTLFKGTMHQRLENDNGVVIYATAKTSGLASSTGVTTVTITLE